jgi:hypothetical protein
VTVSRTITVRALAVGGHRSGVGGTNGGAMFKQAGSVDLDWCPRNHKHSIRDAGGTAGGTRRCSDSDLPPDHPRGGR